MQVNYVGPTVECVDCERDIPKKNTRRVSLGQGKNGSKCEVCIIVNGTGRQGASA